MKSGRQALPRGGPESYKVAWALGTLDGDGNLNDDGEVTHVCISLASR